VFAERNKINHFWVERERGRHSWKTVATRNNLLFLKQFSFLDFEETILVVVAVAVDVVVVNRWMYF
jgi:hypothetical protein